MKTLHMHFASSAWRKREQGHWLSDREAQVVYISRATQDWCGILLLEGKAESLKEMIYRSFFGQNQRLSVQADMLILLLCLGGPPTKRLKRQDILWALHASKAECIFRCQASLRAKPGLAASWSTTASYMQEITVTSKAASRPLIQLRRKMFAGRAAEQVESVDT